MFFFFFSFWLTFCSSLVWTSIQIFHANLELWFKNAAWKSSRKWERLFSLINNDFFFYIINICRIFQFDLYFFSSSHSARTPLTHAVPLVDLAECPHEYGCLLRFYYPVPMKDFLDPYSAAVLQQWPFFQCVLLHTGRGAGKKTHMHK